MFSLFDHIRTLLTLVKLCFSKLTNAFSFQVVLLKAYGLVSLYSTVLGHSQYVVLQYFTVQYEYILLFVLVP